MHQFKSMSVAARTLVIICTLLVLILIFWVGMAVGYKQAEFAYRWDRQYDEVFGGKGSPFGGMGGMMRFSNNEGLQANGASGRIIAINLPYVAVKAPNLAEKVIVVGPSTVIRFMHDVGTTTDMRIGDVVIAVGSPDAQGRTVASFIRIMPSIASSTDVFR